MFLTTVYIFSIKLSIFSDAPLKFEKINYHWKSNIKLYNLMVILNSEFVCFCNFNYLIECSCKSLIFPTYNGKVVLKYSTLFLGLYILIFNFVTKLLLLWSQTLSVWKRRHSGTSNKTSNNNIQILKYLTVTFTILR